MSISLIGRFGQALSALSPRCSVDVVHGLVLLFGIGTAVEAANMSFGQSMHGTQLPGKRTCKFTFRI
jgi:hypothetical protein